MQREPLESSILGDRSGSVLPLVVISLVMLLGMVAMALDMGMMASARSEAQRAADAGAHAGAGTFMMATSDEAAARATAQAYAEQNQVRWGDLEVRQDEDIDVIMDEQTVRVRVHRTRARGNPVATLFARIFGIGDANVGAVAAAQVWPADRTDCLLPFAVPDRWLVNGQPASASDVYVGPPSHVYKRCEWTSDGEDCTGYSIQHIGDQVLLKMGSPGDAPQPGWYYPIRLPQANGANDYRAAIMDCWPFADEFILGQDVMDKEPGNMQGPTRQGFTQLIGQSSGFTWRQSGVDGAPCPFRAGQCDWGGAIEARRVRPVPMFDPDDWPDIDMGSKPVPISNIGGLFVESVQGNGDILARVVPYSGFLPGETWSPTAGTLLRTLRIIE